MAIQYLRIGFQKLLPRRGAQWLFAYLGRADVLDHHARRWVRFAGVKPDLVHEDVLLPDDAAPEMHNPAELARAMDRAEGRLLRKRRNRKRWPQVGASFVAALPPDSQVSYDEAIELTRRLARRIRDGLPIPVYFAIHDPARDPSRRTSPNRHAHLVVPLRGMDRIGFLRTKLRNVFARPRTNQQNVDPTYVAEGVNWPRLHRELQMRFFLERGLDLVVDPPLPIGNRHWSETVWREEPEAVEADRAAIRHRNRELLFGNPAVLLDRLLRGRSIMPIAELHRFLALFIDNEADRNTRLEQILTDPGVSTFAVHPQDRRPSRISTSSIHELVQAAVNLVRAQARSADDPRIVVKSEMNSEAVTADLEQEIGRQRERALFLVGDVESDCVPLKDRLGNRGSQLSTIEYQLKDSFNPYRLDGSRSKFQKGDLVVLPRSEKTDDSAVAELIVACAERGAHLLVGYDQSRQEGIVSNRLAAYLAESLGATAVHQMDFRNAELHLSCGWPGPAIEMLGRAGILEFEPTHDDGAEDYDFLVSDDPYRIAMTNQNSNPGEGLLEHGPDWFSPGDWITFTKTDYGDDLTPERRPISPTVRENRLAQFIGVPEGRRILISHGDEDLEEIDLRRFPHLRRAAAISIRQAYYAPAKARLKIELTKSRYAWASLLLALRKAETSKLQVDPSVARDANELLSVVRRSMPSALSSELAALTDPEAALTRILEQPPAVVASHSPGSQVEIEEFPVPSGAAHAAGSSGYGSTEAWRRNVAWAEPIERRIQRDVLHEQIWDTLASTPGGEDIVNQLEGWAASENRKETFDRLVELYRGKPMEALVRAFMDPGEQQHPAERPEEEEMDEPLDMMNGRPREWSANELAVFRQDIKTFGWQFTKWSVHLAQIPDTEEPEGPG